MAFRGGMEFDDSEINWHSSGVLGGRYKSGKALEAHVTHAVPDRFYKKGKIFRTEGEALCNRKLGMADSGQWGEPGDVTCPKCMNALIKMGVI